MVKFIPVLESGDHVMLTPTTVVHTIDRIWEDEDAYTLCGREIEARVVEPVRVIALFADDLDDMKFCKRCLTAGWARMEAEANRTTERMEP